LFSRLFIGKYVSDLLLVKASLLERDTYYFLTYLNIFKELDKLSFLSLCFLFGNGLQNYNLFCYLQMFIKLFLKNILIAFFLWWYRSKNRATKVQQFINLPNVF